MISRYKSVRSNFLLPPSLTRVITFFSFLATLKETCLRAKIQRTKLDFLGLTDYKVLLITVEFLIQALEVNVPPPNVSVGSAQAVLVRNPVTVAPVQPASVAPEIIQQPQNRTVQIHPVSNIVPQPPANTVTTLIPPTNNAVVKQRLSPMPVQSVAGMLTNPSIFCNLMHRLFPF